jgi:hypothetical protein
MPIWSNYDERMSTQGEFSLPPLETDGHIDLLTGLDAPGIFYRFLEKAISSSGRYPSRSVAIIRVRLGLESLRRSSIEVSDEGLAFRVVQLAKILRSHTRSDEHLVRIGEVTFLILVTVGKSGEIDAISSRLARALAEATLGRASLVVSVDGPIPVEKVTSLHEVYQSIEVEVAGYPIQISIDGFLHETGEEMISFLERVGV